MRRTSALLLYAAMSVPFGVLIHLGSEFMALGRDADDIAFSPLHAYLGVTAIVAFGAFLVLGGFFAGSGERRRRLSLFATALPWQGRGPQFLAFSVALQFGFFLITQFGEGCPLCGGDMAVGIVSALVASIAGGLLLRSLRSRIVRIIVELCEHILHVCAPIAKHGHGVRAVQFVASTFASYADVLGNRPPPLLTAR